jgi:hypothetical protein
MVYKIPWNLNRATCPVCPGGPLGGLGVALVVQMYTNEPPRNRTRGQQEVEDFIGSADSQTDREDEQVPEGSCKLLTLCLPVCLSCLACLVLSVLVVLLVVLVVLNPKP